MIRAVVKTSVHEGIEVLGIEDGYEGLLEKRARPLISDDVSGILTHGGTILGTSNTANPFRMPVEKGRKVVFQDFSDLAMQHYKEWQLDALIAVGGDGTLHSAYKLFRKGMPVVGIPKTIDNDLGGTDYTFGFHSAVSIATESLDRLHTTAASHHRVMILEVMGRNAGWISLYAGSAGGADIILIPEIPFNMQVISDEVKARVGKGKRFSLVIVAEGAHPAGGQQIIQRLDKKNPYPIKLGGIGQWLAKRIEEITEIETRAAVLGHIQRGGSPTAFDRNLGTLFGTYAVSLLQKNQFGNMVVLRGQKVTHLALKEAVKQTKKVPLDHPLVKASRAVGTSFGD